MRVAFASSASVASAPVSSRPARPAAGARASGRRPGAAASALAVAALTLALPAVLPSAARAEQADRDKPTNVESDRMHYDERKQTTVFTGRVVLTKGTLVIRGDELTLRQDANSQQLATAIGKPATFRQKRDGPGEQYVHGTGATIDYDSRTEKLVLTGAAIMARSECGRIMDQVTGAQIIYDGQTETFNVDGKPSAGQQARNPSGRVRLTIQPRPDAKGESKGDTKGDTKQDTKRGSAPTQPCPSGESIKLQPDIGVLDSRPSVPNPPSR